MESRKPMSEIEVAYSTGIFDGEGCINIGIHRKTTRYKPVSGIEKIYVSFRGIVQLVIGNTNRKLLERVRKCLGFSYIYQRKNVTILGGSTIYDLREVNPKKVLKIIRLMKPYSEVKDLLELSEKACIFILNRKYPQGKWNYENLDLFEKSFVEPFKKIRGTQTRGAPRKYYWRNYIEDK